MGKTSEKPIEKAKGKPEKLLSVIYL